MPARTPEECDHLFGEYVNRGDLDALLKLYDPTGSLVQRDGGVASVTRRSGRSWGASWPCGPV